jgi:hypothetical protein
MFIETIDISRFCTGSVSAFNRALITGMAVPVTPPSPKGYHNWMPGSQAEQLALALKWAAVLAVKAMAWNVPAAEVDKLGTLNAIAVPALAKTTDPNGCTHSETTACEVAFANLRAHLISLKNRYLTVPPSRRRKRRNWASPSPTPAARCRTPWASSPS